MAGKTATIAREWKNLKAQLSRHAPLILKSLNPRATDRQIRELEKSLGLMLPPDFRQSLAIHDGQTSKVKYADGGKTKTVMAPLFDGEQILPIEDIIKLWKMMGDLAAHDDFEVFMGDWPRLVKDSRIKHDEYWNIKWIPITNSEGDGFCIDMDPGPGGNAGQVFYFCRGDHWPRKDGVVPWRVLVPNFTTWLGAITAMLNAGEFALRNDGRAIQSKPAGAIFSRLLATPI